MTTVVSEFNDTDEVPIQIKFGVGGITVAGNGKSEKDFSVNDATKGFVLKSPNGHRWRLQVTNLGLVVTLDLDA